MPKVSPYGMKRPEASRFVLAFSDPEAGVEFEVPARRLGNLEQIAAAERASVYTTQYVTGWGRQGSKDYTPPDALPPVGGQAVYASEAAFTIACCIAAAQTSTDDGERYDPIELVSFMVSDELLSQMQDSLKQITATDKEEKPGPLAQTASVEASSATASTEARPTILA